VPRDGRKNYIGLVNETTYEVRLTGDAARARPRLVTYLARCLAAVLKRPRKTTPERGPIPS
jgi:hypothetical protein